MQDRDTMTVQLLATKLYISRRPRNLVRRRRLAERLDDGLRTGHRLTLVSAPAGYGKTKLLSTCVADVECDGA